MEAKDIMSKFDELYGMYAHSLALDLLKDKDGVYDIREYFLK